MDCNTLQYKRVIILPKAGKFMCKSIDDYYRIKALVNQGISKNNDIKIISFR